jgi:hypothetical protein
MHAPKGSKNLDRILLAKKVIANVVDFDMHNLFPSRPPLENMEDAASGAWEVMPHNVLRERSYGSQPLLIRPTYKGDFLKQLDLPYEGKSMNIEADGDPENLKDFSSPEDWLKHQERPHPRVNLDEYYDFNRPGEGAGGEDLKEFWDRGWEHGDSPEMSEDKWLRMWAPPKDEPESNNEFFRTSAVVASYLNQIYPIKLCLDTSMSREAKTLKDLEAARIHGDKKINFKGVNYTMYRSDARVGRWTFTTGSKPYVTVFQFIPHGSIRDPNKLHVRVSCTCPSFLFYGAQYNALMGDYLYGKIRPKFAPPRIRDPQHRFLVCKHILACYPFILKVRPFIVKKQEIEKTREDWEKIKKAPKFQIEKEFPEEKLRIPADLVYVGKKPHIKKIVKEWEEKPASRHTMVKSLKDEDEILYVAHRFPESAAYVAKRLKELSLKPAVKAEALQELKEIMDEKTETKEVNIPKTLQRFEGNPGIQEIAHSLEKKTQKEKRKIVDNLHEPESLAYLAHKMSYDPEIVSVVGEKLNEIKNTDKDPKNRKKADEWLRIIF